MKQRTSNLGLTIAALALGFIGLIMPGASLLLVTTMPASAALDDNSAEVTRQLILDTHTDLPLRFEASWEELDQPMQLVPRHARGLPSRRGSKNPITIAAPIQVVPVTLTLSVPGPTISGSVIVTATISEQITAIKAVLFLDETPRSWSTGNLFTWDWMTTLVANGEHNLMVEAYNAAGELVASGGITVTVDNAVTPKRWMLAGLSDWQVHDVETSPNEPGVAYAAVGVRVYKTMDWGAFWGSIGHGLPIYATFHCLSVDPADPQNVFLGTSSGVYASQDGGETWQPCGLGQAIKDIAVGGTGGKWGYVISWGDAVYRSSDGGNTWITVLEDVGALHTLSVDPGDGRIAYVGCGDPWTEAVLRQRPLNNRPQRDNICGHERGTGCVQIARWGNLDSLRCRSHWALFSFCAKAGRE